MERTQHPLSGTHFSLHTESRWAEEHSPWWFTARNPQATKAAAQQMGCTVMNKNKQESTFLPFSGLF